MSPGIILEQILARVKDRDLQEFKEKILPQEEAMEKRLKKDGFKNMSMLVEESKARMQGTYLDYNDMGKETNIDGEVMMLPGTVAETPATEDKPAEPRSGKEMFDNFLKKIT
jgi:hypothetical protein